MEGGIGKVGGRPRDTRKHIEKVVIQIANS